MSTAAFKKSLTKSVPILFANIGWAVHYDGTEPIRGNFDGLPKDGSDAWESRAFNNSEDSYYYCGIGLGQLDARARIHVVYVSRAPTEDVLRVVGIYAAAAIVDGDSQYPWVRTKTAHAFPVGERPPVNSWPGNQGVRRWAWRGTQESHISRGKEYAHLRRRFRMIATGLISAQKGAASDENPDPVDAELAAFEGVQKKYFIKHRTREAKLRRAKIRKALANNRGRLVCEVPKCGFDFVRRYGEDLGGGYAQVHHKKFLQTAPKRGFKIMLDDLAIVCANCHAMIHRGGACRPLEGLIP